jgi:hypothetical protein
VEGDKKMIFKDLIPKNMHDISNKLYSLTDDEMKTIIYDLLEWIQDYNWPVIQELISVLKERKDVILDILRGDDHMWKYCIMDLLIPDFSFKYKCALKDDVLKLINDSDNDEDTDSIREIAKGCYKNCGFWEIDYE